MGFTIPKYWAQPKYIYNQSGVASFSGDWIDCAEFSFISINVWWTAVALTSGTIFFQESNDFTEGQAAAPDTGSIVTITLTTPTGGQSSGFHGNGASFTVGATASKVIVKIENPSRLLRFSYTASAGGGANQFFGAWLARGS